MSGQLWSTGLMHAPPLPARLPRPGPALRATSGRSRAAGCIRAFASRDTPSQASEAEKAFAEHQSALFAWQKKRLEGAFRSGGRRHTNIKQLVGDTKLDRKQVLDWLKLREQQPERPAAEPASQRQHAEQSMLERTSFAERTPFAEGEEDFDTTSDSSAVDEPVAAIPFADRMAAGGDFPKKRLKKSAQMTMEKVFDRYRWPPDDVVAGVCQLHSEMTPMRVKAWFEEQRRLRPATRRR